ncbi:acyloxyacyl hydrolase [Paraburkholderia sp. J63]|uniref:acyloxyacyl hydrolase n=1 Tax=Paraburkholderia sp. J63 TaxID=2805434 RepID=UPI002ABE3F12|nr:acyloxyacyl hydrolase [Paraburkholderia sp. J63]
MLSHVCETDDRSLSSSFQFADMVGVGAQSDANQNYQVGFRFQHLSNVDLNTRIPGSISVSFVCSTTSRLRTSSHSS